MQFEDYNPMVHIYAAACYFYMGLYKEAEEEAERVRAGATTLFNPCSLAKNFPSENDAELTFTTWIS